MNVWDFLNQHTPGQWKYGKAYENDVLKLAVQYVFIGESTDELGEIYEKKGWRFVRIWEDIWQQKPEIVQSRLLALVGLSERIPARLTLVKGIDQTFLNTFLNENHLQITARCKYRYGLFLKPMAQNAAYGENLLIQKLDNCVAVAGFGPLRLMPLRGEQYYSGELIRFANVRGYTVVGGLDKLIQAFVREHHPDDLMTYADRDWSAGHSYERLGFERVGYASPQVFWLNPETGQRQLEKQDGWALVQNRGSYKYIKRFRKVGFGELYE
ncbi:MAG: hypothetical protein QM669_06320 [Siphonobacter sp.]